MIFYAQDRVFPEHSRNTAERSECVIRVPRTVGRGTRNTRIVPGTWLGEDPWRDVDISPFCPACGARSNYDKYMDLYHHTDGSDDHDCRLAILRGQRVDPVPHALYRFWSGDELLYVGITMNPAARWPGHRHGKEWWHEITTITIEQHGNRERVFEAEKRAIKAERPKYNIVWNGDKQ